MVAGTSAVDAAVGKSAAAVVVVAAVDIAVAAVVAVGISAAVGGTSVAVPAGRLEAVGTPVAAVVEAVGTSVVVIFDPGVEVSVSSQVSV